MSTKTELLIACISRVRDAYLTLETAKYDCDAVVDSEIDELVSQCSEPVTAVEKKNIKKIAKAFATNKANILQIEAKSLAGMLVDLLEQGGVEAE